MGLLRGSVGASASPQAGRAPAGLLTLLPAAGSRPCSSQSPFKGCSMGIQLKQGVRTAGNQGSPTQQLIDTTKTVTSPGLASGAPEDDPRLAWQ